MHSAQGDIHTRNSWHFTTCSASTVHLPNVYCSVPHGSLALEPERIRRFFALIAKLSGVGCKSNIPLFIA